MLPRRKSSLAMWLPDFIGKNRVWCQNIIKYQQEVPTTQLTHGNDTLELISHQHNNAVTFTSFQPHCTNTPERLQCSTPYKLHHHLISPHDRMAVHNKDQCFKPLGANVCLNPYKKHQHALEM